MKKKITALLLIAALTLSLTVPALAGFGGDGAMSGFKSDQVLTDQDLAVISARLDGKEDPKSSGEPKNISQQEAVRALLLDYADMKKTQLGVYPADYISMAKSAGMLDGIPFEAEKTCTAGQMEKMIKNTEPLYKAMHAEKKEQFFVDGMAQPIFEYSDPTKGNGDSGTVRFCVYVETNYDTDDDGKLDLVKALVQLPREVLDGMKVPMIYEARPYNTGCIESIPYGTGEYDLSKLHSQPDKRVPAGKSTTAEAVKAADVKDWNYLSPQEGTMAYEDLDWYDYYLVRGFGVILCGGLGTLGSEGYETAGSDVEIDAFACVLEWLAGKRTAYTDREHNIAIEADWYNGSTGATGRSYAGSTVFGLATVAPVGLKTIVPVAGIASWYDFTNTQGIYTEGDPAYSDTLAVYCGGRYLDPEDFATIAEKYGNYLNQLVLDQRESNGDYNDHWKNRDYTVNADKIRIPALVVHGLNDWNVRTKQFEMMYNCFKGAGQDVKLLLHQGAHITPTQPAYRDPADDGTESYGKAVLIDGRAYDDVLNKWYSHYLFGVDNGAEDMATVTVQNNVTGKWDTYDKWDEDVKTAVLKNEKGEKKVLSSDYLKVDGVEEKVNKRGKTYLDGWEEAFVKGPTPSSYIMTKDIEKDFTLAGTPEVRFTASTDAFEHGLKDAVMVSAILVDVAPKPFTAFSGDQKVVSEKDVWNGGGLVNFDTTIFEQSKVDYKIVTKGWMDLYNPNAGFESKTAVTDKTYVPGNAYEYTMYLQPSLYTFEAGHQLLVVLFPYDPGLISYDAVYHVDLDGAKTYAKLPYKDKEQAEPFYDVSGSDWFYDSVQWAVKNDVTAGTSTTAFSPEETCTRKQAAMFLWKAAGKPEPSSAVNKFTDVPADAYYAKAVLWAAEKGITSGTSETTFSPEDSCTRKQIVFFLYKFAGDKAASAENKFTDVKSGDWFYDAVQWAVANKVTSGTSATTFSPDGICTRGEMVTFLYNYFVKKAA